MSEAGQVTISTHVLDTTQGVPASSIGVTLERRESRQAWELEERGSTDDDGRLRFGRGLPAGEYRLTFGTGEYFRELGTLTFYPEVTVTFMALDGHYHVPLLLSPFAYSTYRGS